MIQDQGLTLDEADGQSVAATDVPWLNAALDPIYKAVWPQACGYGSNPDGTIFVHVGKGCTPGEAANPVILSLAGVSPSQSPRDAFMAVKAACDIGTAVRVRYAQAGAVAETRVACVGNIVAPQPQKALEVRLTYQGVALEPGDKLELMLIRQDGDNAWRRSLAFDLANQTRLPDTVTARVDPELFRGGAPMLKATLYTRDGSVRAISGERPLPMLISQSAAVAQVLMAPVGPVAPRGGPLSVRMDQGGAPLALRSGEQVVVELADAQGLTLSRRAMTPGDPALAGAAVSLNVPPALLTRSVTGRVYRLEGSIQNSAGLVIRRAEPVTLRVAAGSRGITSLRPTLSFDD